MGREGKAGGRRRRETSGGARAALTVLVVGGTALGTLLLHPGAALFAKGRGPLGGNTALVICGVVLALLGGYTLRERYLQQVGARQDLEPAEQRLVDGTGRVLSAAPLVLSALILLLHRFGPPAGDDGDRHGRFRLPTGPPPPPVGHSDDSLTLLLARILTGVSVVLLLAGVVIAAVYLRRHFAGPSAPGTPATYAVSDDEPEQLAEVVDSGRRALLEGTEARTAVIGAYAAMEESLAASGTARRASDTPQDLLERAVSGGVPARAAAAELTALFREARYSTHPMDDGHRDRAAAALAEIAHDLRARERKAEAVAGDA